MKTLLFTFVIVVQCAVVVAQHKLVGTWSCKFEGYTMTIVLKADGAGTLDGNPITYKFTSTALTINEPDNHTTYNYVITGNQMVLSGGDLQSPLTFSKGIGGSAPNKPSEKAVSNAAPSNPSKIVGIWQGNGEVIEFKDNNMVSYQGQSYSYTTQGDYITFITNQGNISFQYSLSINNLTLRGNNSAVTYTRTTEKQAQSLQVSGSFPANAKIAQEIVGKWCIMKGSSSYGSQTTISSSSECITIRGDGTYEYYYEGGFVNKSSDVNVSTASDNYDRGSWRLVGNTLYVQSQKSGFKKYTLIKQNNKNKDPMIVIDGKSFVTYYNKPAW